MTEIDLRFFPKPTCYPNQKEAMASIQQALMDKKIILFEGACGTGKTLSALAPSLAVARQRGKMVVIATNVHQQMAQFIQESREIRHKQDIKVVVLKGKQHMCPRDEDYETCSVLTENTYELLSKEKEAEELKARWAIDGTGSEQTQQKKKLEKEIRELRDRYCRYLYKVAVMDQEDAGDPEDFTSWFFEDVRTPEEVNEWAFEREMCGYELIKRRMAGADLLICNFHHILNFDILTNLLGWLDRGMDEIILIIDEAHNLEAAARSHSSMILPEYSLARALEELTANEDLRQHSSYRIKELETLFRVIHKHLKDTYESRLEFGERERLPGTWKDVSICDPRGGVDHFLHRMLELIEDAGITDLEGLLGEAVELGQYLDDFYKSQYKKGHTGRRKRSQLLRSTEFIRFYLDHSADPIYYPILNIRMRDGELEGRMELVSCIPRMVTSPLLGSIYACVLMSATLQPYPVVRATLDINRPVEEITFGMTFPEDNRLTIAIDSRPLFARNRDDPATVNQITRILEDIIEHSDGNILIFFQSYHEARMYHRRITAQVPLFLDEIGTSSQQIRDDFFALGESGHKGVIFSYLWGTLAEGVDYKDERGRVVVVVGIGYPALNDRMRAIESAYDHEFPGLGWDYAIQVPTIRKIRQAMGRIIRSPRDYGVRILLDGRYTSDSLRRWRKYSVYNDFPPEERIEIIDVKPEHVKFSLMNFFNDMKRMGK